MAEKTKYVVVCLRHRDMYFAGNAYLFWGPDGSNYTAVLQTAGLYTFEQALEMADEDDVPISIDILGYSEEYFKSTKNGFKDFPQLVLLNIENKSNKELINVSREWFREQKALKQSKGGQPNG